MTNTKLDTGIKILIGALFCVLGWVIFHSTKNTVIDVGDTAPDFAVTTNQGVRMTPTNFGGKLLVLNFWGSWCDPCIAETPSLNQFAREMAPSGVVVLGLSVDTNPKRYEAFLKRFQIAFPTALDTNEDISASFGTYKFPETYIIKNGRVVSKIISDRNWMDPEMINMVKSLL